MSEFQQNKTNYFQKISGEWMQWEPLLFSIFPTKSLQYNFLLDQQTVWVGVEYFKYNIVKCKESFK